MSDIVERLRNAVQYTGKSGPVQVLVPLPLCRDAADEIERLRAELAKAQNLADIALERVNEPKARRR
jgi:hypothetical protein